MSEALALRNSVDPEIPVLYSFPRIERRILREHFHDGSFFVVANVSRGRPYRLRRNPLFWIRSVRRIVKKLKIHRPKVGVFIGSVDCIPGILAAKIMGIRIIFIESITRIEDLSITGKFVYFLNLFDEYFVLWPSLDQKYKRVQYKGHLQRTTKPVINKNSRTKTVLVSVGSTYFDEMIERVDNYFINHPGKIEIIYQIGSGKYIPRSGVSFQFTDNFDSLLANADLIITHGGVTVMEAVSLKKSIIAVPNFNIRGDHQTLFLRNVSKLMNIQVAWTIDQIDDLIANSHKESIEVFADNLGHHVSEVIKSPS